MASDDVKIFLAQKPPASPLRWMLAVALLALAAAGAWFYISNNLIEPGTVVANPVTATRIVPSTATLPAPPVSRVPPVSPIEMQDTAISIHDPRKAIAALDGHLQLYLPFSSSLEDHSHNHFQPEAQNAVTVRDGAAYFPGNSFLTFPHVALDNRSFACSVWIKLEGPVVGDGILEQVDGGPGKHLHLLLRDSDRPYMGFFMNDLIAPQNITAASGWTHIVYQFTGTHQQIWINGLLSVERNSDPYRGEKGETRIGKAPMWNNVPTQCFKGAMRELRLYDTALKPAQIRMLAGLDGGDPAPNAKPDDNF